MCTGTAPLPAASKGGAQAEADLLQSHWLEATRIPNFVPESLWEVLPCRTRSKLRSEEGGGKP
jgi:hypothetical protein